MLLALNAMGAMLDRIFPYPCGCVGVACWAKMGSRPRADHLVHAGAVTGGVPADPDRFPAYCKKGVSR